MTKTKKDEREEARVTLRLPQRLLDRIDYMLEEHAELRFPMSRNTWIIKALDFALGQEEEGLRNEFGMKSPAKREKAG